jgi:phytoene synthase
MMTLVMGTRSPSALARACELGVAMQLTNIARDVGEDARSGRLYLPRQWLREEGLDPDAWLRQPVFNPAIARITAQLLAVAEGLYRRAEHGVAELPMDCRPAIQAARLVYAEIGHQLQRNGLDAVNRRTVVSGARKLALVARATTAALRVPAPLRGVPALPAVQYLVDAAASSAPTAAPQRNYDERMAVVIGLFERQAAQGRAWR